MVVVIYIYSLTKIKVYKYFENRCFFSNDLQLEKLKSATKIVAGVILRLLSKIIGTPNENRFSHKLLVTDTKVKNLCETFAK